MFAFNSPTLSGGQTGTEALGQLTWLYTQAVLTPSQGLVGTPPAKWSFSSAVNTNSVLTWLIPSAASRVKNVCERVVVRLERGHVACLAGTVRRPARMLVVRIGDVGIGDRDAVFLHVGDIGERDRRRHAVKAGEARRVGDRVDDRLAAQVVQDQAARPGPADLRVHVLRAVERIEAVVAAGLIRQQVGLAVVCGLSRARRPAAQWTAMPTKSVNARFGIGQELRVLRRVGAEHLRDVERVVLQHDIRGRDHADVAAGAGVRHPGRRRVVAVGSQHVVLRCRSG